MSKPNPFYRDDTNGWYWYDEIENEEGPYDTKEEAITALEAYANWLDGQPSENEREQKSPS